MESPKDIAACKRKVRYGNDVLAQATLKKINPSRAINKPARVYKCSVCGGFHLTSKRT